MEAEFVAPKKDNRGLSKKDRHSHNLRDELQLVGKKQQRMLQSLSTADGEMSEQEKFEAFYDGLSKKEKQQWDKMQMQAKKIESKGVTPSASDGSGKKKGKDRSSNDL